MVQLSLAGTGIAQAKRAELDQLISAIELPELNKQFLRARWLEQSMWMEEKALDALWR
jgi:hypothetical protein